MTRCPACKEILVNQAKCECGWTKRKSGSQEVDRQCVYQDESGRCDITGWMAFSTNGGGPWYCSGHFFQTKAPDLLSPVPPAEARPLIANLKAMLKRHEEQVEQEAKKPTDYAPQQYDDDHPFQEEPGAMG